MRRITHTLWLFALAVLVSSAHSQVSLDLNVAPGDQGEHERMIKPGETFTIELVSNGGASGAIGFTAELKFDTSQISFKGFAAGGLMAGAMSMPPKPGPSGVEINAAIMGGGGSTEEVGSLGHLLFEAGPNLTRTPVEIASASFGSSAGVQPVAVGSGVMIINPDALGIIGTGAIGAEPATSMSMPQGDLAPQGGPAAKPSDSSSPPPRSGQTGFQSPPGRSGAAMPAAGPPPPPPPSARPRPEAPPTRTKTEDRPRTTQQTDKALQGTRPDGSQGAGEVKPNGAGRTGFRSHPDRPFPATKADRVDTGDIAHSDGGSPPPRSGQTGFQSPPGRSEGSQDFQNPGSQGGQPQGRSMGRHSQGRSMGRHSQPQGGQRGPGNQGGQSGHGGQGHEPINPEEVISKLPASLQEAFKATMEVEHNSERAHVEAELAMQRSVRSTLEQTKRFLASASPEDQETVGKALWFFHNQDDRGHDPMGGRGMQQGQRDGGPGQQDGTMPQDVNEMVKRMIEEVERDIKHLEQELQQR